MKEIKDMAHIRHFIWDFDGTLLDTYPTIIGFLRSALQDFGFDCDPVEAMGLMLDTIRFARDHYADKFGIPREALKQRYLQYHAERTPLMPAKPFDGVKEVLERICNSGRFNYIYTHRDDNETVEYLKKYGLSDYFQEIVGWASPHFAEKPSGDSILYLMNKYGMTAEDTAMVGDRACDLESGKNAGVATLHFVCSRAPQDLDCSWKFNDFDELLQLL